MNAAPVLLLGAGRMGGALLDGWRRTGAFAASELIVVDPAPGAAALRARDEGAALNPPETVLRGAGTVLLALKPQGWREAAAAYAASIVPGATIVSVMVGVGSAEVSQAFAGRRTARAMPTTGVAIAKGVATIFAESQAASRRAHRLFDPVATTVDLDDEALMDAAAATSGSAPAYLYAFVEALAAAGADAGLPPEVSARLARATIVSAAALLDATDEDLAALRAQVASPGGTTEAALRVLAPAAGEGGGLAPLMRSAVAAAVARAGELARHAR